MVQNSEAEWNGAGYNGTQISFHCFDI
jgi:hypothetical protein